LKEAADVYKVDAEAIDLNVKQEFMAKEKARTEAKQSAKPAAKAVPRAKKAA
jgi:ParB family chromosome partitioning protein